MDNPSVVLIFIFCVNAIFFADGQSLSDSCVVPEHFRGDYYGQPRGEERYYLLSDEKYERQGEFSGRCLQYEKLPNTGESDNKFDAIMLFYSSESLCFECLHLYYRTPNVLEYRAATCINEAEPGKTLFQTACDGITIQTEIVTMFKRSDNVITNCKQTIEGTFNFTYERDIGGGSICENADNKIVACQLPGSLYTDNQVFDMVFNKCPKVTESYDESYRFECMGSWRRKEEMLDDGVTTGRGSTIFSAVADIGEDESFFRYRCLVTEEYQELPQNQKRFGLSREAKCDKLLSSYDSPIRLLLAPVYPEDVTGFIKSSCNLPKNFTGTWFSAGEFDTDVIINSTHIYFKTKFDQFSYKETYFTCQMNRDSRYLVSAVTIGRCEIDYVCFDFEPRHENVIRWRMSKPYRLSDYEMQVPQYLERKFRQACSWSSFTIDREEAEWTYSTFLLNPPAPVNCPIGGRYMFEERGNIEERYYTRIRGITERPRHTIDCHHYVSEFKSCDENPKMIFIDKEYCETADHTGRPIGEYDIADRELTCVGHWMEDMQSYMITYDEEDATSQFRCWVYERINWRDLIISRATRARCGRNQTARSYETKEGASLALTLKESERLFDTCPQRYDNGATPGRKLANIFVTAAASSQTFNVFTSLTTLILTISLVS